MAVFSRRNHQRRYVDRRINGSTGRIPGDDAGELRLQRLLTFHPRKAERGPAAMAQAIDKHLSIEARQAGERRGDCFDISNARRRINQTEIFRIMRGAELAQASWLPAIKNDGRIAMP